MENGREPNAGVSLMGYIIVIPIFFTALAFAGNWIFGNDGWRIIYAFFAFLVAYTLIVLPRLYIKYKNMLQEWDGS
jgi:phosphoglycerol transferase MdoB-like AlkP superfamily enzyme